MRTEITKIIQMKHFFNTIKCKDSSYIYNLEKPSKILLKNIYTAWLQSIYTKTQKSLPVFFNATNKNQSLPFGCIKTNTSICEENVSLEHDVNECSPNRKSKLEFDLFIPKQDTMQTFIQWQRYRKYWWSSITTTPSLFAIGDIKYENGESNVNIVANFPGTQQTVEKVTMYTETDLTHSSQLNCSLNMENALFILLLDGLTNSTKEEYLRIHRKMAPYKFSFAIHTLDSSKTDKLQKLAKLLFCRLEAKRISTWLPTFSLSLDAQVKENLQIGVAYTVVLSEETLSSGIFHLLNSSTMLKEQLHVADFDTYAGFIFEQ